MRQRFHLRHLGAIIVAVGLMLLISCLTVNPPAQAEASGVSTTVVITKNGFDPPVVTIEVGQSVLWTNQSPQAIRVKGGEPHQLYLPMIRTNSGSAQGRTAHESVVSVPVTPAQGTWLDLELAPGQSYSHSFTTIGNYPYFLTTQPDKTGLVRVVEAVADFGVELAPRAQALVQGRLATVTVALTETVRLTQPVALSITGLPSGVSASFNPPTTTTTTVLTLNATAEAATGIYGVTIQGTAGDVSQTATLSLTVASMAFTTTTAPSGIALELNQVVYETGDDLTVVLEFGDIVPPTAVGNVFVASPGSGDVEVIALQATGNGRFTSSAPLPLVAQAGVATPADGTLSLVPGEQFAALYYIDQTQPSLAAVDEEIVADLGLFAGGDTSLAPVSILSELALTDDERVPPPGAKPTGTLLPNGGIPIQIATKEVILFPRSDAELDRFLAKSGGVVLGTQAGDDESLPAVLIAVDTSTAPTAHLAQLRTLFGEAGTLFASNTTVLDMYAFLLAYQLEGYLVAANPRIQPQTAPALQEREALAVTHTMEMVRANTTIGPCIPGDATRPCVNNVPAIWAFTTLWGADTRRINLALLDMGFATNDDFRRPAAGNLVECNMNVFGSPTCGPGRAQGSPTVGNSFFGDRSWHGTGVVTTAAGVINNDFGAAGVGGQVAVPMLYKFDLGSYAFEIGSGIRKAVADGASCINISGGYPCRILTNIGPDFNLCTIEGRAGICAIASATVVAAAAATCAATAWIPFAGPFVCAAAVSGATIATAACVSTLAFGDLAGPMHSAVRFAASRGVPVVTIAGNALSRESFPETIRDYVAIGNHRTEDWGIMPAMAPEAIVAGAVDGGFSNVHFFGNRVDIWAPIRSTFFAPSDVNDPSSTVRKDPFGLGGTSAAAPFIAGLITVMQALNPELNPHAPGITDAARRDIVPRLRDILTDDDINFTNTELVALGFTDQPVERRRLVNPLAAVQAAATGAVPDSAALGYDTSLNFSELLVPNDIPAQALSLSFGVTTTGSLIELAEAGSTTTPIDDDWFSLTMPAAPTGRIYETTVTIRHLSGGGNVSLVGDNVAIQSRGGSPEISSIYRLLAPPAAPALVKVTGTRSVYKLVATTPQLAIPEVAITQPAVVPEICAGSIDFAATAVYRGATTLSVPSNAFAWTASGVGAIGTGATVSAVLVAGTYTVTVRLFDEPTIADTRVLRLIDCEGGRPVAAITVPAADSGINDAAYAYDGFDDERDMWYTDVELAGTATDPEDGVLTGAALMWTTSRTNLQAAELGAGASLTVRLYSNECVGTLHEIVLIATDSVGNRSLPAIRRIRIWTLC